MPYRQIQSNLAKPILEISWRQGKTWWVLVKSFLLSWIAQKLPPYQSSERAQQHNAEWRLKLNKTDNLYHISWLQPRQQKHNASINHCIHLYCILFLCGLDYSRNLRSHTTLPAWTDSSLEAVAPARPHKSKRYSQWIPMKLEKDFKNVWKDEQKHAKTINNIPRLPLTFGQYMLANSSHEVDTLSDPGAPVLSQRQKQETLSSFMLLSAVVRFCRQKAFGVFERSCVNPHGQDINAAEMLFETQTQPETMQQCHSVKMKSCSFRDASFSFTPFITTRNRSKWEGNWMSRRSLLLGPNCSFATSSSWACQNLGISEGLGAWIRKGQSKSDKRRGKGLKT